MPEQRSGWGPHYQVAFDMERSFGHMGYSDINLCLAQLDSDPCAYKLSFGLNRHLFCVEPHVRRLGPHAIPARMTCGANSRYKGVPILRVVDGTDHIQPQAYRCKNCQQC